MGCLHLHEQVPGLRVPPFSQNFSPQSVREHKIVTRKPAFCICEQQAQISCLFAFAALRYCSFYLSHVLRKPAFCICENKDADQLRGNREADQRLCFRYTDSTISLLPKYEISSLQPSSVALQPGLCGTWS